MTSRLLPALFALSLLSPLLCTSASAAFTATQAPPPEGIAILRDRPTILQTPTGKTCKPLQSLRPPLVCVNGEQHQQTYRIEYEFNDAGYVAELTWIPENQFRPAPDGRPVPLQGSDSAVLNFQKTRSDLAARRKLAIETAAKAKADAKSQAVAEAESKRQAEAERIAAQRREREKDQQRYIDMKKTLVTASGIAPERAMVWAGETTLPPGRGGNTEAAQCFGWVNYKIRDYPAGAVVIGTAQAALQQELGTPLLGNPVYNGATGEWTLQVASSECGYSIPVRIKAPGTDAAKAELLALKPGVVFQLVGETLVAKSVQLFGPEGARHTVALNVPAPARFDLATALSFKARNEAAKRAAQQTSDANEAKLREHYWGKFVLAIKDTGLVCQSLKQQMLGMRAQGVQDWQLDQLAREHMADPSMRSCVAR